MPANIEIKAALKNRGQALATAARLADHAPEILHQEDVFYRCEGARLKLRIHRSGDGHTNESNAAHGELIRYQRENCAEVRRSSYLIARTGGSSGSRRHLAKTLGVIGTVRKTRTLFLVGQTRVHIDQVEGLGDFLELEVVLREGQREEEAKQIANALLAEFGITSNEHIAVAYIDLLASASR